MHVLDLKGFLVFLSVGFLVVYSWWRIGKNHCIKNMCIQLPMEAVLSLFCKAEFNFTCHTQA